MVRSREIRARDVVPIPSLFFSPLLLKNIDYVYVYVYMSWVAQPFFSLHHHVTLFLYCLCQYCATWVTQDIDVMPFLLKRTWHHR